MQEGDQPDAREAAAQSSPWPVRLVLAGGTIGMAGDRATPTAQTASVTSAAPELERDGAVEVFSHKPSVQFSSAEALALAQRVSGLASSGTAVVVTHGTDLLEEITLLCDLLYDGEAPVVFTGAMRSASAPGADGPANVRDSLVAAQHADVAGLGAVVCFAGELHAARSVRKLDSTGPAAFGSPIGGPLGFVAEDRVWLAARPSRRPALRVAHLNARVEIVQAGLGSDGALVEAASRVADGLVAVLPGAGHSPPAFLRALVSAAERIPVVVTARPARGAILRSTYGFEGSEGDVRAAGLPCAGALSPAAARLKLMACLGAGMDRQQTEECFALDDL